VIDYGAMRKMLIEVKYRENTGLSSKEAIVEWANDARVEAAIVATKNSSDYGRTEHASACPIVKIPAFAFLYLLGHAQASTYGIANRSVDR